MLSAEASSMEMVEDVNRKPEQSGIGGILKIGVSAVTLKTTTHLVTATTQTEEMAQLTLQ